jgi:CHAD domain-containing protein
MSPPPLDRHLKSLLAKRLDQLDDSLKATRRARGVDSVHDLRVASRRLRAFGITFRELLADETRRGLEKKLKRLARAVSGLRDLDVQLELLAVRLAATSQDLDRAALEHLLEHLALQRAKAARNAKRRLDTLDAHAISRRVQRALRGVTVGLSERQPNAFARSVLEMLVTDAAEQAQPLSGPEDAERLHRLRIDFKQLRYALELFEPMLGESFQVLYERATMLQELLGAHHDLVVLADVVGERSAELRERHRDALVQGLDGVTEALSNEREAVLRLFRAQGFDAAGWRDTLDRALGPG